MASPSGEPQGGAGLCARCVYAQQIISSRKSVFLMCKRSSCDLRFAKYPKLPVRECLGFKLNVAL
jgi:hypothetical protein